MLVGIHQMARVCCYCLSTCTFFGVAARFNSNVPNYNTPVEIEIKNPFGSTQRFSPIKYATTSKGVPGVGPSLPSRQCLCPIDEIQGVRHFILRQPTSSPIREKENQQCI